MLCLTRIRFALVLRKIHFTLDDKLHFCGICIVMLNTVSWHSLKRKTPTDSRTTECDHREQRAYKTSLKQSWWEGLGECAQRALQDLTKIPGPHSDSQNKIPRPLKPLVRRKCLPAIGLWRSSCLAALSEQHKHSFRNWKRRITKHGAITGQCSSSPIEALRLESGTPATGPIATDSLLHQKALGRDKDIPCPLCSVTFSRG